MLYAATACAGGFLTFAPLWPSQGAFAAAAAAPLGGSAMAACAVALVLSQRFPASSTISPETRGTGRARETIR